MLAGDPELLESLSPDKLVPSPDKVPERFELGTLPYEVLAGATASVDFLAAMDPAAAGTRRERLTQSLKVLHDHEMSLRARLQEGLDGFGDAITVHCKAPERTPTVLMSLVGRDARDALTHLASRKVVAAAGSFYAYEPFRALKLEDPALRVGLAPYNSAEEVDRLLEGVGDFL